MCIQTEFIVTALLQIKVLFCFLARLWRQRLRCRQGLKFLLRVLNRGRNLFSMRIKFRGLSLQFRLLCLKVLQQFLHLLPVRRILELRKMFQGRGLVKGAHPVLELLQQLRRKVRKSILRSRLKILCSALQFRPRLCLK